MGRARVAGRPPGQCAQASRCATRPQVGRSSPADILLPIPTVSSRHALLRVGAQRGPRQTRLAGGLATSLRQHRHGCRNAHPAMLPLAPSPPPQRTTPCT